MKVSLYKVLKGIFVNESNRLSTLDKVLLEDVFNELSKQYIEEQFYTQCQDLYSNNLFLCMIIYKDKCLWDYPNEFNKLRIELYGL